MINGKQKPNIAAKSRAGSREVRIVTQLNTHLLIKLFNIGHMPISVLITASVDNENLLATKPTTQHQTDLSCW